MSEEIILCKEIKNKSNKYCNYENCKTIPSFNFEGEKSALYCSTHKKRKYD